MRNSLLAAHQRAARFSDTHSSFSVSPWKDYESRKPGPDGTLGEGFSQTMRNSSSSRSILCIGDMGGKIVLMTDDTIWASTGQAKQIWLAAIKREATSDATSEPVSNARIMTYTRVRARVSAKKKAPAVMVKSDR
ncbi:hypothetical protein E4U55_000255 [Claviceps digitariae]|nr:hypothetical protein E4U55_000255 [Claviceps digitariae]